MDRKDTESETPRYRVDKWLEYSNRSRIANRGTPAPGDGSSQRSASTEGTPSEPEQSEFGSNGAASDLTDGTTNLFKSCHKAWDVLVNGIEEGNHELDTDWVHILRNEAGRFSIWGDGFEARNGGLENMLDGVEEIRETVIVLLASVALVLQRLCRCGYPNRF